MWEGYWKLIETLPKLWRWIVAWRFRQVFGRDAGKEYHIVHCIKSVPHPHIVFRSPKEPNMPRRLYANATNLTEITAWAETRAIAYLVYSFGENVKLAPAIRTDVETDTRMDISFISTGGLGNLKTCDLLEDVSDFLRFDGEAIMRGQSEVARAAGNTDCAFIIKTRPKSNPERTWLCCAGVGEWGTSGAAWFLATKWKDIRKWAKKRPFAIITKTSRGVDESTQLVRRFLRYTGTGEFTELF